MSIEDRQASQEIEPTSEVITLDHLLRANASDRAGSYRDMWQLAKEMGNLTVVVGCADARLRYTRFFSSDQEFLEPDIEKVTSIAVGGNPKPYEYLFNHRGTSEIVVSTHSPCGGQHAKAELIEGHSKPSITGIMRYVDKDIFSSDPLVQAQLQAERISMLAPGKNVYAAFTLNPTGTVGPISMWRNGEIQGGLTDIEELSGIPLSEVPLLDGSYYTDEFGRKMEGNRRFVARIGSTQEFQESQVVQNPRLITITTDPRPMALTLPGTDLHDFTVKIPQVKNGEDLLVGVQALESVFDQIEYPLSSAVEASRPNDNFLDSSTVLIATANYNNGIAMRELLLRMKFFEEWAYSGQARMLHVVEMRGGIMNPDKANSLSFRRVA